MSLIELLVAIFFVCMIYYASHDQAACVQMGENTFGVCRDFYESMHK